MDHRLSPQETRLHAALCHLIDLAAKAGASARHSRDAIARLALSVLCGDFGDGRVDVVRALQAVPWHLSVEVPRLALVSALRRGDYTRDLHPVAQVLSPEQWRVLAWVHRYAAVYGVPPMLRDVIDGVERKPGQVGYLVTKLVAKGAIAKMDGRLVATRSP